MSRWLTGKAQPRLPEFLRLVEVTSRRMLDFIAGIVDPARLPSAAGYWQRLKAAREAAYESPWSHAVLRALELDSPNTRRSTGWIAARLGVEMREVETGLEILERTGQVEQVRGQWRVNRVLSVDTSADPVKARKLKIAWSEVALNRLRDGHRGIPRDVAAREGALTEFVPCLFCLVRRGNGCACLRTDDDPTGSPE